MFRLSRQYSSEGAYRSLAALYCSGYFCAARAFKALLSINYRRWTQIDVDCTYWTFFCVHSKSLCTSLAACIPSAKFALDLARRALACACIAASSRLFALSSPDLLESTGIR